MKTRIISGNNFFSSSILGLIVTTYWLGMSLFFSQMLWSKLVGEMPQKLFFLIISLVMCWSRSWEPYVANHPFCQLRNNLAKSHCSGDRNCVREDRDASNTFPLQSEFTVLTTYTCVLKKSKLETLFFAKVTAVQCSGVRDKARVRHGPDSSVFTR